MLKRRGKRPGLRLKSEGETLFATCALGGEADQQMRDGLVVTERQ
jgi:hypothetical protein